MTLDPQKVLTWACEWCKTVPPYSRWWIHDALFDVLALGCVQNSRFFSEEPVWQELKVQLRTVSVFPKSAYDRTHTPCKECKR